MWMSPTKFRVFLVLNMVVVAVTGVLHLLRLIPTHDTFVILAIVALLVYFPPYILVPIHLHRNHKTSAQVEYKPINPGREVVPEESWERIREGVSSLKPCGFQVVGHFEYSAQVSGAMAYLTLLQDANRITVARLGTVFLTKRKGHPAKGSLRFVTELVDGTGLSTSNSATNDLLPTRQDSIRLLMPEIQDSHKLYDFHLRLIEEFGKSSKTIDLNGDALAYLTRKKEQQTARWVNKGYYWLDSDADLYRLTWKGAVLTAWKNLWPIKPIRYALRKHQTNKLLRKLQD